MNHIPNLSQLTVFTEYLGFTVINMFGRDRFYPGERILYEAHPRFILNSRSTLIKVILSLIIVYYFQRTVEFAGSLSRVFLERYGFNFASTAVIILLSLLFILLISIMWDVLSWRNRRYLVTDQRVIVESGVIRKKRFYIHHDKIVDVVFSQGLTERLLNSADVEVYGGHEGTHIVLEDAPSPSRIEHYINRSTGGGTADHAAEIIRELSDETPDKPGFSDPSFWESDEEEEQEEEYADKPGSVMERHSRKFKRLREEDGEE